MNRRPPMFDTRSDEERAAAAPRHVCRFGMWRRDTRYRWGRFVRECRCGVRQEAEGNEYGTITRIISESK